MRIVVSDHSCDVIEDIITHRCCSLFTNIADCCAVKFLSQVFAMPYVTPGYYSNGMRSDILQATVFQVIFFGSLSGESDINFFS